MANVSAINAICSGLMQTLDRSFQISSDVSGLSCAFHVTSITEIRKLDSSSSGTVCTLFLYRISHNEYLRNRQAPPTPVTLDLHLMFTVWADNPATEQTVQAWLLRELHENPVIGRGMMGGLGGFGDDEQVQMIPEDLSLDDLSKIWQSLTLPMRLSAGFVARNIRIDDADPAPAGKPVVARRFAYSDELVDS